MTDLRSARESDLVLQRAHRERDQQREEEWQARTKRLESQLAGVLKQLEIKEAEHGGLLRQLIERHVVPTALEPPKRKRAARS